jgi:hypothetical protein
MDRHSAFGQDLLATGYTFFRFAEVVSERVYAELDMLYDMRVARTLSASRDLLSALRNLQRHLSDEHKDSLRALGHLTDYLLNSFSSALNYKRRYSSSNPWGLPIDVSIMDASPAEQSEFSQGTVHAGRLAAMGMLLVHYFTLEFTVMLAHIEDSDRPRDQLLPDTTEREFRDLMLKIFTHESRMQEQIAGLLDGANDDTAAAVFLTLYANVGDVNLLHRIRTNTTLKRFLWTNDSNSIMYLREIYYSVMVQSMSFYGDNDEQGLKEMFANIERYFYPFRAYSAYCPSGITRSLEDRNPREELSRKFQEHTPNPAYEYATLPLAAGVDNGQIVLQKAANGGIINVVPRRRVHVWRKKMTWTGADWKLLASTTGELGLMMDLANLLPSVVACNRKFRTSPNLPIKELHSVFTRFFGAYDYFRPDIYAIDPGTELGRYQDDAATERNDMKACKDPVAPNAVSIQPMPEQIVEWTNASGQVGGDPRWRITNAVFQRCTSLNVSETLKASNVQPEKQNVVYTPDWISSIDEATTHVNKKMHCNSMYLLHVGSALLHVEIPTYHADSSVLGSDGMMLDSRSYYRYHYTAIDNILDRTDTHTTITYGAFRSLRSNIQEWQKKLQTLFSKRTAGFLHPACWLTTTDLAAGTGWQKLHSSTDVTPGTVVNFAPMGGDTADLQAENRALSNVIGHFCPTDVIPFLE